MEFCRCKYASQVPTVDVVHNDYWLLIQEWHSGLWRLPRFQLAPLTMATSFTQLRKAGLATELSIVSSATLLK
jgi:hypothetical protein